MNPFSKPNSVSLNSPSFITPTLGTPSSGTLTNCTGLPQAGVTGLTTSDSPVFGTVKLSNLTDGYLPKHTSDSVGLVNSPIYTDGTNVGIGTSSPSKILHSYSSTTAQALFNGWDVNGGASEYNGQILIGNASSWQGVIHYDAVTNSRGNLYIDNTQTTDTSNIYIRTKTISTPINALTILGSGLTGFKTTTPASIVSVLGNLSVGATYANIAAPTSGAIFEGIVGIGTSSTYANYIFHVKNGSGVWQNTLFETLGAAILIGFKNASSTGSTGNPYIEIGSEANNFFIRYDQTPIFRITSSGSVGLGNITPASKLSIPGNLSVGATYANIAAPTSGAIFEGNVGIGTSSPACSFQVETSQNSSYRIAYLINSSTDSSAQTYISIGSTTRGITLGSDYTGNYGFLGVIGRSPLLYAKYITAGETYIGIGTNDPTAIFDINSDILRLRTAKTPASAGAEGNAGDICWDSGAIYVCVATNTWKKALLATW